MFHVTSSNSSVRDVGSGCDVRHCVEDEGAFSYISECFMYIPTGYSIESVPSGLRTRVGVSPWRAKSMHES